MCRTDNLTTFICRLSWNLGASTSWNPQSLSKPVMGLLYLYFPYLSTDMGEIWYRNFHTVSLSIFEFCEKWCTESHTLLMGHNGIASYFVRLLVRCPKTFAESSCVTWNSAQKKPYISYGHEAIRYKAKFFLFTPWWRTEGTEFWLHAFLTSALDTVEWLTTGPTHFTLQRNTPWVGVWVDPGATVDNLEKREDSWTCRDPKYWPSSP